MCRCEGEVELLKCAVSVLSADDIAGHSKEVVEGARASREGGEAEVHVRGEPRAGQLGRGVVDRALTPHVRGGDGAVVCRGSVSARQKQDSAQVSSSPL